MTDRARLPILLLLIAATAAVYAPSLGYGFVYDDARQIEMSRSRFTWSQAPGYFTSDVWSYAERKTGNYYRPGFLVWLLVNYKMFGLSRPLWHASAVALHVLTTLLLFFLARRITGDDPVAGMTALLFGVHPVHVEAVAWVSGATEPLTAALWLAALLGYLRGWRVLPVALFGAALFSKETAITLPAVLFVYEWRASPDGLRAALRRLIPYLGVVAVYLGFRTYALRAFMPRSAHWPIFELLLSLPETICFYLRQLLWPARLGLFHEIQPVANPSWRNFFLPWVLLMAGAAAMAVIWRASRAGAIALILLIVPLLPVLDLPAFGRDDFVHDRYLYLPAAGLCLLAAIGLLRILTLRPAVASALAAAAILSVLTVRESRFWRNDDTLAAHALDIAPHSVQARQLYAVDLVLDERYADALPLLADPRALAVWDKPALLYTTGLCLYEMGHWEEAEARLREAIALHPDYPQAHMLLGMAEARAGRLDQAEAEMRQAIQQRPRASLQYSGYHAALAGLLEQKGDFRGALAEYEIELQEQPGEEAVADRAQALRARLR